MTTTRLAPVCMPTALLAQPRAQIVLGACGCSGASLFLFAVDPSRHAVYPQCFLYNSTGIYCAGCGATRALHALLHGRVLLALHDNALFVTALPVLLILGAMHLFAAWRDQSWPVVRLSSRTALTRAAVLFAMMVAFMVLRNLPAFAWLRPLP